MSSDVRRSRLLGHAPAGMHGKEAIEQWVAMPCLVMFFVPVLLIYDVAAAQKCCFLLQACPSGLLKERGLSLTELGDLYCYRRSCH